MKRFLLVCVLFLTSNSYTFYDAFQTTSQQYTATFKGTISLTSQVFSYSDTNTQFSFDYGIAPVDRTDMQDQLVIKWVFSKLYNQNVNPLFVILWDNQFENIQQNLAYSVRIPSGEYLAFDTRGRQLSIGQFFKILFPIVNTQSNTYQNAVRVGVNTNAAHAQTMFITTEGWNYFSKPPSTQYRPLIETNAEFLSRISQTFENRRQENNTYWMQTFTSIIKTSANATFSDFSTAGFYIMDNTLQTLKKGVVNIDTTTTLMYKAVGFEIPVVVKMDGQIILDYIK